MKTTIKITLVVVIIYIVWGFLQNKKLMVAKKSLGNSTKESNFEFSKDVDVAIAPRPTGNDVYDTMMMNKMIK